MDRTLEGLLQRRLWQEIAKAERVLSESDAGCDQRDALEQELVDLSDELQTARTALHAAYAENLEMRKALDLITETGAMSHVDILIKDRDFWKMFALKLAEKLAPRESK